MVIERTAYRAGALRRASYFVRLPTPPEWVAWLEAAGISRRAIPFRRRRSARAGQLGTGGGRHGLSEQRASANVLDTLRVGCVLSGVGRGENVKEPVCDVLPS